MIKQDIINQENSLYSLQYNKDLDCYDLILKQANYQTSIELLGILSFIHQIGVSSNKQLRIGAKFQ